jgi:predicted Zn-dependent peptidase
VSPEEVVAGVNSVSSGDVMKLAVEVLTPGRASFAYVGPEGVIGGEKQAAALLAAIE